MAELRRKLLVVDDEFTTREALMRYLGRKFDVTGAENGSEAIEQLKKQDFDLVLTDLRMPEADGMSVLDAAMSKADAPKCILLTAYGSINDAVTAMKKGAFDFVTKPVKLARLEEVISAAIAAKNETRTVAIAPAAVPELPAAETVLPETVRLNPAVVPPGDENDPMHKIFATALTVAPSRSTVLISGESGTGKEVVARFIHDNSRRTGLFVPVHCAALSANLLESELFGHEKGAFTGANEQRRGRFELADGGTVFLDEIGEIDAATQVKLLRVLESRSFERVGGTETIQTNIRLIAATNRDLKSMVEAGEFREDLYYRLSVINLHLPPLRERREEIPVLVNAFVREFSADNGKVVDGVSDEAMQVLSAWSWPGNIRELRNTVECMVVLNGSGIIGADDLPEHIRAGEALPAAVVSGAAAVEVNPLNLEQSEKELIRRALAECGNNRSKAAVKLGISRRTLYRKLEQYGLL